MSANNYLRLSKEDDFYTLQDCFVESPVGLFIIKTTTLLEVIKAASDYQKENIVEYGLTIDDSVFKASHE